MAAGGFLLAACKPQSDRNADEKQIRAMLANERKAHFDRDVELFVKEFSDNMLSVNKGNIKYTPPDTMRKSIGKYFGTVQFIKWDDTAPPVIRFSDDRSLAYALVKKEVIVSYPDQSGKVITDTTHYAWASVYRKEKGEWKMEANISTNK
jgi:hypothetical protein